MRRSSALFALVAALALPACTGTPESKPPPAPRDLPSLGLKEGAGTLVWRGLDALATAKIALPPSPPSTETGTFPLDGAWAPDERRMGRLRVFTHPLPFATDMPRPNYAPMGARLYRGGTEIPFVNDPDDLRGGGWFVEHGTVTLLVMEDPSKWSTPPRIEVPELAAEAARRVWTGKGDPVAFVRASVTRDGVTEPGLQLSPGGTVTFRVDVPADATLQLGLAQLEPLLPGASGGRASLEVSVGGEQVLSRDVPGAGTPTHTTVDLAKHAGAVELTFAAPASNEGNVVVTNPTIVRRAGHTPRRVVVVGIDTLRQDELSLYGYGKPTTPELDAWAAQSIVFDAAWAPAPRTRPSFRTALTGRYPIAAASAPTIAEPLREAGFRTAGIAANVHLVPRFGFNSGFEEWHYENGARAEVEVERGLQWLKDHEDEDTFLFLHLMDPHTFYNAPEPYGSKFLPGPRPKLVPEEFERWQIYEAMRKPGWGEAEQAWVRAAYDGEVAYTSAVLSHFFTELDALPGSTLTIVHSDHGEEMWDHGGYEHNHTIYEELVRVAMWIRPPGGKSGGVRIPAPVGLVDLVPTVLDLVGVPGPASDGRSLAAFVDPDRAADAPALTQALATRPLQLGHLMFGHERWGVVSGGQKYILHTASGEEEVYDLAKDRAEKENLAAQLDPERMQQLRAALAEATGWPVRPGWRFELGSGVPMELVFDGPIAAAGVVDPEAERSNRANLEWGEHPALTVDEVANVSVSEDHTTVRVVPTQHANGHRVWVSCDGACPAGRLVVPAGEVPIAEGALTVGRADLTASSGTIIEVPATDEHLAAPESGQMEALKALGYVAPD